MVEARIAELEGRLAKGSSLSFKVSEKGAVSVYGLGRFPVTLFLPYDRPIAVSKIGSTSDRARESRSHLT